MKLIDKLKNALFEEEYVEVEEKPKRKPVKKEIKPERKEHPRKEKEEKPIAKKIVPPEKKEVKITRHDDEIQENHHEGETLADENIKKKEFNFPLVSDNEFKEEKPVKREKKVVEQKKPEKTEVVYEKVKYQETKTTTKAYGMDEIKLPDSMYGAYEKKEERTYFHPSPIISPIYGILDKNYKKEEIVPKKEVRLTSAYARENLDLDEVREKAFGIHSEEGNNDAGADLDQYDIDEESNFMDNDLLDLSEDKPEVKKVTVGDAEEYFEDLGLEYNVDYKDLSKDNTRVGRRYKEENVEHEPKIIEEKKVEPVVEEKKEEPLPPVIEKKEQVEDKTDEDNLFDLIDSMYEKE